MSAQDCDNPRVGPGDGDDVRVADAMVAAPKTMPADATVADLRAAFANPHVLTALLVDGTAFAGAVERGALRDDLPDDRPARALARRDMPTIGPDAPLSEAIARLDADGGQRLVVVDRDGRTLRGLLCLTSDRSGFCSS
ncbi:MAG TPA: CBS domain-containing protein [Solirubrobacteraceae bacterium]|nr:CBS domain-containing protein [Solirubrobacteraceae bacterium]